MREGDAYTKAMLEKHVWICAFMLVGALNGGAWQRVRNIEGRQETLCAWACQVTRSAGDNTGITVGEVEAEHSEQLRAVIAELCAAGATELGVKLDDGAYERLAAYGRSVAHFPTAVKEFEWRNGWFYDITVKVSLATMSAANLLPLAKCLLPPAGCSAASLFPDCRPATLPSAWQAADASKPDPMPLHTAGLTTLGVLPVAA